MLKSLNPNELEKLKPLIVEYLEELQITERSSVDYVVSNMASSLHSRIAMVFADDTENPSLFLWGVTQPSLYINAKILYVISLFIKQEKRSDEPTLANIRETLDIAAHFHGCHLIYTGERKDPPLPEEGAMWRNAGFTEMETTWMRKV